MKKAFYPTTLDSDFNQGTLKASKSILDKRYHEIINDLQQLLQDNNKILLTCILRMLAQNPFTERNILLIGWFAIQNLIPGPFLTLLINMMITNLDTTEGINCGISFMRAVLPRAQKFLYFAKQLFDRLGDENIELKTQLDIFLSENIPIDSVDWTKHTISPHEPEEYTYSGTLKLKNQYSNDWSVKLPSTVSQSLEFAQTLPVADQPITCVHLCLSFSPPKNTPPPNFPILLESACNYAILLFCDSRAARWEAFYLESQIYQMGHWIGYLTYQQGKPIPLHLLDIHTMMLDAIENGFIRQAIIFLKAVFYNCSPFFEPPNPITVDILEMLAGILIVPNLRQDIYEIILSFGRMLHVDVPRFQRRRVQIPFDSFDLTARFCESSYEMTTFCHPSSRPNATFLPITEERISSYFNYEPDFSTFPHELLEIYESATKIERYYFTGTGSVAEDPYIYQANEDVQHYILSMALTQSPIVSKIGSNIFEKFIEMVGKFNVSDLFRCAFPNKAVINVCLKTDIIQPSFLNSLFSELLTNNETRPFAAPRIRELLPLCKGDDYFSTYSLLGMKSPPIPDRLPLPSPEDKSLLFSLSAFSLTGDDNSRLDFISKINTNSLRQLSSIFSFALHSAHVTNSPSQVNETDYSGIDGICYSLGRSIGRVDIDALSSACLDALRNIASSAIFEKPHCYFRLVYGLLSNVQFKHKEKLIDFLNFLGPENFPSFACCWMQLVMHRNAFGRLVKSNDKDDIQFCVSFVIKIIELAYRFPEIFYKAVVRMMLTIASHPLFFISYHQPILEHLPLRMMQIRNIILGATPNGSYEILPPPTGFKYTDSLGPIRAAIDSVLKRGEDITSIAQAINAACKKNNKNTVPRVVWQFVYYVLSSGSKKRDKVIATVAAASGAEMIVAALFDQLRYPNTITEAAQNVLMEMIAIDNANTRDIIVTEALRRKLCITPPPPAVSALFAKAMAQFGGKIREENAARNQSQLFEKALSIIESNPTMSSSSSTSSSIRDC